MTVSEKTRHIAHSMKYYCIFVKLYRRINLPPSLRQIVYFALELEHFVCDHATSIENEKLWSEGIAMYMYSVSIYYM